MGVSMSRSAADGAGAPRARRSAYPGESDEYFSRQRTPTPDPLVTNLARGVLEVLAGVREVDQLARWLSEDAFRRLVTRSNLATRARSARGVPAVRPHLAVLSTRSMSPADGVVEAVVIVSAPHRTRAIALRLEGTDGRWRATSLAVL
jgi:hypothetical protein